MLVSKKVALIVVVVCIAVGAVLGSKWGAQNETLTITKDRVVTQIKEVTRPDGTVVRDTTRVEDRQQVQSAVTRKPDWTVQALYGINEVPYYGVGITRRIVGDLSAGVQVNTRGEVMAILSYQF